MGLLSDLIIHGVTGGSSSAAAAAAARALIPGLVAGSASRAVSPGIGSTVGAGAPPPTVAPVTVHGTSVPSVSNGSGSDFGGAGGSGINFLLGGGGGGADALAPVTVHGAANANTPADTGVSAADVGAGAAAALAPTVEDVSITGKRTEQAPFDMGAATPVIPSPLLTLDGSNVVQPSDPSTLTPMDPQTALLIGGGLAGAGGLAQLLRTPADIPPESSLDHTTGGGLLGGVPIKDLVAAGLLGAGVLGGGGSGSGAAGDALKGVADNASALSNRLGNIADAGFQGNIGGKGLNSINRMVRNAQAAIRQRYAAMGMSGSTAEGDDLNAAAEAGVDQQFKIGQQMAQTGLTAIAALTGQSAAIYTSLLNAATAKDTALGNAVANFAGALVH